MQTLAKCSSRHFTQPRGLLGSTLQYSIENKTFDREGIFKLWSNFRDCRSFHSVSKKVSFSSNFLYILSIIMKYYEIRLKISIFYI